jgi:hypothetical protein
MAAVAIYEAHHGRSKQAIKLRAAFMRRHAVGVEWIGAFHSGLAVAPTNNRLLFDKSHLTAANETTRKNVSSA